MRSRHILISVLIITISYSSAAEHRDDRDTNQEPANSALYQQPLSITNKPHAITLNQAIVDRYFEAYRNARKLVTDAKAYKATASEIEISERLEIYSSFLPENLFFKNQIHEIIIIEKFLQQFHGIYPSEIAINTLYTEVIDAESELHKVSYNEIEPFLKSLALFSDPQTIDIIREKVEEEAKQEYENEISKKVFWSTEELKINGNHQDCLATESGSNECLVTIGQFNAAIAHSNISKMTCKDSARNEIVRNLLSDIYYAKMAEESGYSEKQEVRELLKKRSDEFKHSQKFISLGKMVTDKECLYATYRKYYDEHFRKKEEVYINLVGSSDSAFIDSVYLWLCAITEKQPVTMKNTKIVPRIKQLPWQRSNWNNLPDELVLPTDTLYENEFTKPIKTAYGYYIAHIDKIETSKEITFEEAYNKLTYLATRDKWKNPDSLREELAYQIYCREKSNYVTPDTMKIDAFLSPFMTDATKKTIFDRHGDAYTLPDTSRANCMRLSSTLLPSEVQERLKEHYYKNPNGEELLGPIYTRYGAFYFRVLANKTGRKQRPYNEVFNSIITEIKMNEKNEDFTYAHDQGILIERMFLGNMYFIDDISKIRKMSFEDIKKLIDNKTVDMSGINEARAAQEDRFNYAREKYETMKIAEYNENCDTWIRNIFIDASHFK